MNETETDTSIINETMERENDEQITQETTLQQTPPEQSNTTNKKSYKGFSTSINGLFTDPEDCCMFFCFGIFLTTKTRYLFTNEYNENETNIYQGYNYYCRAVTIHYILPIILFHVACGFIALQNPIGYAFLFLFIIYLIYILRKLVKSRVDFRLGILNKIRNNDGVTEEVLELQEFHDRKLSNGAHNLCCGSYPLDDGDDDYVQPLVQGQYQATSTTEDESQTQDYYESESNFCTNVWKFVSSLCCGKLCKCWCMCCGICALAQESREMKYLVPKSKHYIDFYTFEPFTEYYPKIQELRQAYNESFYSHLRAISKLSSKMLNRYYYFLILCFVIAMLSSKMDSLLVLLATFLQAFIILYFIQWRNNRFIVSLDAIIKYFTLGFIFATTLAQFFELLLQVVFALLVGIPFVILDGAEIMNIAKGLQNQTLGNDTSYDANDLLLDDYYDTSNSTSSSSNNPMIMKEVMEGVAKIHPILFIFYIFFLSYVVAAVTEELCKYFGYLVLIHPESIPEMNIIDNSSDGMSSTATALNQIEMSTINRNLTAIPENSVDDTTFTIDDDDSNEVHENRITIPSSEQEQQYQESLETIRIRTMIHMVSVATGFACCENISYIFGMSGNVSTEIMILALRSLLPVHPICAAIQSIGVTKRHLLYNNNTNYYTKSNYNIGRIILPAVILHGSFDFFLFFIGYMVMYLCGEDADMVINDDDDTANSAITCSDTTELVLNMFAYIFPFLFVIGGIVYYIVQSRRLKQSLREIDFNSAVNVSGLL